MKNAVLAGCFAVLAAGIAGAQGVGEFEKKLQNGLKAQNASDVESALRGLVTANSPEAVDAVTGALARIGEGDPAIYWQVVDAAAAFTGSPALTQLGDFLSRNGKKPFGRDIVYALQSNRSPHVHIVLGAMLDKKADEACQVMAAEFFADIPTKEAVDVLIAKLVELEKKPGILRDRVLQTIVHLTGKNLGESGAAYQAWWDVNRETAQLGAGSGERRDPTGTAVDSLPPGGGEIERLKKGTIIVLVSDCPMKTKQGAHKEDDHDLDHMQTLLKKMDLPYQEVLKSEFEKFDLTGKTALLINCNMWRAVCHGDTCGGTQASGLRTVACTGPGPHHTSENKLSKIGIEKVKKYVERDGGYLFTEDWVLPEVLDIAWPDLVREGDYLKGMQAPVTPSIGVGSHPYMRRIFGRKSKANSGDGALTTTVKTELDNIKHTWKIDDDSPSIRIANPAKVIKLMVSKEVGDQTSPLKADQNKGIQEIVLACGQCGAKTKVASYDPAVTVTHTGCGGTFMPWSPPKKPNAPNEGDDATAISFFPGASEKNVIGTGGFEQDTKKLVGGGRVIHVLSHFGKQDSQDDEFALQNLMLNFLIEANERRVKKK